MKNIRIQEQLEIMENAFKKLVELKAEMVLSASDGFISLAITEPIEDDLKSFIPTKAPGKKYAIECNPKIQFRIELK